MLPPTKLKKVLLATSDPSYILKRSTASLKARRWQLKHWSEWGQPKKMNNYLETNGTQFPAFSVFVRDFIETKQKSIWLRIEQTNKTRLEPVGIFVKTVEFGLEVVESFSCHKLLKKNPNIFRNTGCRPSPLTAFAKSL